MRPVGDMSPHALPKLKDVFFRVSSYLACTDTGSILPAFILHGLYAHDEGCIITNGIRVSFMSVAVVRKSVKVLKKEFDSRIKLQVWILSSVGSYFAWGGISVAVVRGSSTEK